jgi:hypothetical protein
MRAISGIKLYVSCLERVKRITFYSGADYVIWYCDLHKIRAIPGKVRDIRQLTALLTNSKD